LAPGVGVGVEVGCAVGVIVAVDVIVRVLVLVGNGVSVGVTVSVGVAVGVAVGVDGGGGVLVAVRVGVDVRVVLGVLVAVGVKGTQSPLSPSHMAPNTGLDPPGQAPPIGGPHRAIPWQQSLAPGVRVEVGVAVGVTEELGVDVGATQVPPSQMAPRTSWHSSAQVPGVDGCPQVIPGHWQHSTWALAGAPASQLSTPMAIPSRTPVR